MTEAPKTIWAMPTRWADGHGPDVDWTKGGWHKLQAKSPLCFEYTRADTVAAQLKAADELADRAQLDGDTDGISDEMWQALTAYRKAKDEAR